MEGVGIIGAIIIGIAAGWIAEQVTGRRHGLLTNLIVGLVGAFLGSFISSALGFGQTVGGEGGWLPSLITSTIGAVDLLFLLGLVRRKA